SLDWHALAEGSIPEPAAHFDACLCVIDPQRGDAAGVARIGSILVRDSRILVLITPNLDLARAALPESAVVPAAVMSNGASAMLIDAARCVPLGPLRAGLADAMARTIHAARGGSRIRLAGLLLAGALVAIGIAGCNLLLARPRRAPARRPCSSLLLEIRFS